MASSTRERAHADETRARLLEAAVQAFASRGFHGTSTRDIAAAAGLSPAALYVHHPSKEDVLFRIALEGHHASLACILDGVASSSVPREQLVAVMRAFVLEHVAHHTRARVITYELAALQDEHLPEILKLRRKGERALRRVVEAGVEQGSFTTPDVRMTTLAILSLGIDVARWYHPGGPFAAERIAEHYCTLALRMVGIAP